MENINKLEETIAGWYKGMPHLPAEGKKWLAKNVWWLTLIGVIVTIASVLGLLSITFFAGAVLTGFGGGFGAVVGGVLFLAVLVSLLFSAVTIVLGLMAVSPLKSLQKKGWKLLYYIMLVNVVALVLSFLFHFNVVDLVWGLLMTAVGGYFLFEIREFYGHGAKVSQARKSLKKA